VSAYMYTRVFMCLDSAPHTVLRNWQQKTTTLWKICCTSTWGNHRRASGYHLMWSSTCFRSNRVRIAPKRRLEASVSWGNV